MSLVQFECLLKLLGPTIQKNSTNFRECIYAEGVVLTLQFLASRGAQQSKQSIVCCFRISKSTVSNINREAGHAIYDCLKDTYLSKGKTDEDWLRIAA